MKWILTTSLCCLAVLISPLVKGQESDTTQAAETILRLENPYKKGKTKWLNSHGFNTRAYEWDDPAINLNVEKAIKQRSTGTLLGVTGAAVILIGLYANLVEQAFHEEPNSINGPYYLGGAMLIASMAFSISSWDKVKKAEEARVKKLRN